MGKMRTRVWGILLVFAMLLTMLPVTALAGDAQYTMQLSTFAENGTLSIVDGESGSVTMNAKVFKDGTELNWLQVTTTGKNYSVQYKAADAEDNTYQNFPEGVCTASGNRVIIDLSQDTGNEIAPDSYTVKVTADFDGTYAPDEGEPETFNVSAQTTTFTLEVLPNITSLTIVTNSTTQIIDYADVGKTAVKIPVVIKNQDNTDVTAVCKVKVALGDNDEQEYMLTENGDGYAFTYYPLASGQMEETTLKITAVYGGVESEPLEITLQVKNQDAVAYAKITKDGQTTYYASPADAVAAAKDGDTVELLRDYILAAPIIVNKKITIQGANEDIVIQGFGSTDYGNGLFTFTAGSEGSVLKDFTIKYTATGAQQAAVYFDYGFTGGAEDNVTMIQNVDFIGADSLDAVGKETAIMSTYITGGYIEISDCSFKNFKYGMYFNAVNGLTIANNIFDGTWYNAINIAGDGEQPCANIVIRDNEFTNISYANYEDAAYSSGIRIGVNSEEITVEDNNISMLHDKQGVYFDPVEGNESVVVTMVSDGEEVGFYKLTAGETFTVPGAPEKAGYTFKGWKYGDKIAKAGDTVTISESTEFVAQWEEILVTKITLDKTSLTLVKGDTATLTATVEPAEATNKDEIVWTTTNSDIATVEAGKITAVGYGTATITAKIGEVFATCVVNVICDDESCVYYDDLSDDNPWYHPAVDFVTEQRIMQGIAEKTFAPEKELTRAEFAQILYNMENKPGYKTDKTFKDVQKMEGDQPVWYYDAVMWAASTGVVKGYEDDCYYPDKDITRQEMVTMLYRYAEYKNNLTGDITEDLEAFPDSDDDSVWDDEAFAWAVQHGIVNGKDGKLAAGDPARRCEIAKIVMVYMSLV